jgi:hypothetical protein
MTDEAKFSGWLRSRLPGISQRVENTVGPGTPDFCYCHMNRVIWVETKIFVRGKVLLRKEQYAWGMRWGRAGAPVFIIAQFLDKIAVWDYRREVKVEKCGEYLQVVNEPIVWLDRSQIQRLTTWLI